MLLLSVMYVMFCAIWVPLVQFKKREKNQGEVLLLGLLEAFRLT